MQVNVQYASEHLEELLARADRGELIEIIRHGRVFAKLITMPPVEVQKAYDAEDANPKPCAWKANSKNAPPSRHRLQQTRLTAQTQRGGLDRVRPFPVHLWHLLLW